MGCARSRAPAPASGRVAAARWSERARWPLPCWIYSGTTTTAEGYFDDVVLGRQVAEEPVGDAVACSVEVRQEGERAMLTYRAPAGRRVEAHYR